MDKLTATATRLGAMLNTEAAEAHAEEYNTFEQTLWDLVCRGEITPAQYNSLAGTAFYDFEPWEDDIWGDEEPIYTEEERNANRTEPDMGDMYGGHDLMIN